MTVAELIERLKKEDPNRLVVMSSDPEGNSYDTLHTVEVMVYDEDNREVGFDKLTPALKKQGYTEEDIMEDGIPAVILWP